MVNGDPEEKMFEYVVHFAGADKFFIGSEYPHAEGFVRPEAKAREYLKELPAVSVKKILPVHLIQRFSSVKSTA